MRADAHYVDQLSSRSTDTPVRWLDVDEIEGASSADPKELAALIKSVVDYGIVSPLVVRRDGSRFRVITGTKRLAAARSAGLARVPCLVHHVDDAQAAQLAAADNIRIGEAVVAAPATKDASADVIVRASEALASVRSATSLIASERLPMSQKVAVDLVRAESWRALWQLRSASLLAGSYSWRFRSLLLGSVLGTVCDNLAAESRLTGLNLKLNILDWNATADIDEDAMVCGLTGAVSATAALAGEGEATEVSLIARASAGKAISLDITQEAVPVSATDAARFFDAGWADRPGGWPAALGASVARIVAQKHGGDVLLLPRDGRGSTTRLTLGR